MAGKKKEIIDTDDLNIRDMMSEAVRAKLMTKNKATGKYLYELFIDRLVERALIEGNILALKEIQKLMVKFKKSDRPTKTDLSFIGSMFDDIK
jgi:hypothetical protein